MRLVNCLLGRSTPIAGDGSGQSCALVVSNPTSRSAAGVGPWLVELQATTAHGQFVAWRGYITPPLSTQARVIVTRSVPGALTWQAILTPMGGANVTIYGQPAVIKAALLVSDLPCDNAPGPDEGQAGSGGWFYVSGTGTGNVVVPSGAKVRKIWGLTRTTGSSFLVRVPIDSDQTSTLGAVTLPASAAGFIFELGGDDLKGLTGPARVEFTTFQTYFVAWQE